MAGKPEQPASHSGPTATLLQTQNNQQQQQQDQQAALNSVLVYVSGDNLAYASAAIDQQNAALASFQHQNQQQQQQQQQHQQDNFLHLPQIFGDKGFLQKNEFSEIESQEPLQRASSRGSDEDSGHSLGPDDDDLGDDGNFVVSQLEAACDADIIYQSDVGDQQDQEDDKEEHLKLLKLSKEMFEGCNGFAVNNGGGGGAGSVYTTTSSLGFPLDEKSLAAFAAAAELEVAADANGNHQVAFLRQNGDGGITLYQNSIGSDDQQTNDLLSNDGTVVSASQVINLGSCDSVRSDTVESTCSSLSSHESQEVALQQAANFVAAQQAVRESLQQQEQQQQVLEVHQVLNDSMNGAGACSAVQQLVQQQGLQQQQQNVVTVPQHWRRLVADDTVIYFR